jgi:type VI protein secretion system component Hcp
MDMFLYGPDLDGFEVFHLEFDSTQTGRGRSGSGGYKMTTQLQLEKYEDDASTSLFKSLCSGTSYAEAYVSIDRHPSAYYRFTDAVILSMDGFIDELGDRKERVTFQVGSSKIVQES